MFYSHQANGKIFPQTLYLIRGLPGSGKTTFAHMLQRLLRAKGISVEHYEADDYFTRDGVYQFDPKKMYQAHAECFYKAYNTIKNGADCIVANTFSTHQQMAIYVDMAKKENARLVVLTMNGNFQSTHNVPEHTIQRMRERWEN